MPICGNPNCDLALECCLALLSRSIRVMEAHNAECAVCAAEIELHADAKFEFEDGTRVALSDMLEIWEQ